MSAGAVPQYRVEGVDNVLRLIALLRRSEQLRVCEAATHLGVGRSTAHRLLRMLVYRGFATQREDRSYTAGPELCVDTARMDRTRLRNWLRPAMTRISDVLDETVSLLVLDADRTVFVDCVEGRQPLHVRPRIGTHMPAERTSGGRVLLSQLPAHSLRRLYAGRDDVDVASLETMLARTRRQGFGLNVNECEPGVAAVGVCVLYRGEPVGAVTVSAPTLRFRPKRGAEYAALVRDTLSRA
ncbi:IclR family transcriptional regulator [Mycolicibacterium sphagni]|uniref:IclR family transcriptional regulator n=1 Tax=Mycolicibacterium sphagni TaxID=1786 RepID=UPI0021F26BDF|nr:IclR family transcriptional regulator [Mycolicibacterium sphagni]MCV7177086.1 IclR family transcriptional regulator [Mycolicibacterium sphagni]